MKSSKRHYSAISFAGVLLLAGQLPAAPVGTLITYQGHLTSNGVVAEGSYDLRFTLHDAATNGSQVAGPLTNNAVAVSNGTFTVGLDFGMGAFDGQARWLEIAVRADTNDFSVLNPRQAVTATPYALTAVNVSGAISDGQIPATIARLNGAQNFTGPLLLTNSANTVAGSFTGNGAGLTNLDTSAVTNWVLAQGYQTTNGVTRKLLVTPAPANGTNYVVDFLNEAVQIAATNNVNFLQSTNRTAVGWYGESVWYIQGGNTNRTLKFNTNWVGVGTLATNSPSLLLSNKLTIVALSVRGNGETNVTYAIARQE
jgi:hypothetical protein